MYFAFFFTMQLGIPVLPKANMAHESVQQAGQCDYVCTCWDCGNPYPN